MPSKSVAQRRKMAVLHKAGKITDEQWKKFKVVVRKRRSVRKKKK